MLETDRREYYSISHDRAILLESNTVLCNRCLHKNYKLVAIIISTSYKKYVNFGWNWTNGFALEFMKNTGI